MKQQQTETSWEARGKREACPGRTHRPQFVLEFARLHQEDENDRPALAVTVRALSGLLVAAGAWEESKLKAQRQTQEKEEEEQMKTRLLRRS